MTASPSTDRCDHDGARWMARVDRERALRASATGGTSVREMLWERGDAVRGGKRASAGRLPRGVQAFLRDRNSWPSPKGGRRAWPRLDGRAGRCARRTLGAGAHTVNGVGERNEHSFSGRSLLALRRRRAARSSTRLRIAEIEEFQSVRNCQCECAHAAPGNTTQRERDDIRAWCSSRSRGFFARIDGSGRGSSPRREGAARVPRLAALTDSCSPLLVARRGGWPPRVACRQRRSPADAAAFIPRRTQCISPPACDLLPLRRGDRMGPRCAGSILVPDTHISPRRTPSSEVPRRLPRLIPRRSSHSFEGPGGLATHF